MENQKRIELASKILYLQLKQFNIRSDEKHSVYQ